MITLQLRKNKLSGIANNATSNDTDANLKNRANHTGTQSADTITDGTTNKVLSATMKTHYDTAYTNNHTHSNKGSLDLVSGTNTGDETVVSIGGLINGAATKSTPVDTDMTAIIDSTSSNVLKKLSWGNIKSTLKSYFDTIYNNYVHPTTHPSTMITGLTKVANTGDYNDLINKPLILNGKDGTDGYTPIKGIDYFDGKDGTDGINGKDGERGDSGVTVPLNTFFSMYVKANGDLIAVVADGGKATIVN